MLWTAIIQTGISLIPNSVSINLCVCFLEEQQFGVPQRQGLLRPEEEFRCCGVRRAQSHAWGVCGKSSWNRPALVSPCRPPHPPLRFKNSNQMFCECACRCADATRRDGRGGGNEVRVWIGNNWCCSTLPRNHSLLPTNFLCSIYSQCLEVRCLWC